MKGISLVIAFTYLRRASFLAAATALAATGFLAANPASATTAAPAASAATATPHTGLSFRSVQISAASLSPQLKSQLTRSGARPDVSYTAYEVVNDADGKCLDANTSGSTAGQNGDKIQLWTCNRTANQFWIPAGWEANGDAFTDMVNDQYQSMCLNAADNGGLANGRKVQLYNCDVNTTNEFWDFADMYVGNTGYLILDSSTSFVLDATSQTLGNGDQIQIWAPLGGSNQYWS
jgi:Ricin-type beta-trefoil lectin domain